MTIYICCDAFRYTCGISFFLIVVPVKEKLKPSIVIHIVVPLSILDSRYGYTGYHPPLIPCRAELGIPGVSGADRENPRPAASHHDLRTDFRPWHLFDLMIFFGIFIKLDFMIH